jgi:PD-(D/E)XK nuclease superfamily protein
MTRREVVDEEAEDEEAMDRRKRGKTRAKRRQIQPRWTLAKNRSQRIANAKQQGEWAELCFMARAAEIGLCVCKPYGDSAQYDVGIEQGGRMLRVQIKSTTYSRDGSFACNAEGPGHKAYPAGVVDFFAVYLVPVDVWYILPFEAMAGMVTLQFAPERKRHKYQRYMEAWHLLREAQGVKAQE